MANSTAYEIGRSLGRLPTVAKLLILAAVVGIIWWTVTAPERNERAESTRAKETASVNSAKEFAAKERFKSNCTAKREGLVAEYNRLVSDGNPSGAANLLKLCGSALQDAELLAKTKAAEVTSHKNAVNNRSASRVERVASIDAFSHVYPIEAKEFEHLRDRLQAEETKNSDFRVRQFMQKELARRKSEGVSIGMSEEEVRQSSWGRPEKINQSVYSFGTKEQWVYSIGNYLYFENGRLTSMQTSENR